MKLYCGPLSLFSRKVEIALGEKGLSFERVSVPFSQARGYQPKHPDVLATNPKGQVPVLLDGELSLYDSTVIVEYLEDAFPEPPLYPGPAGERAKCRQLELFADEIMIVPLRGLMHRTTPRKTDPEAWDAAEAEAKEAEAAIGRQLTELERRLRGKSFLCDKLTAADIAVFMAVLFGQRLGGPSLLPHPMLADWYARLGQRPAFAKAAAEIFAADLALSAPVERAYRGRG